MSSTPGPSMIGRSVTHYRILAEVGRGGMGVVYRAWDEELRRHVALKFLPPRTLEKLATNQDLRREALALSKLDHPAKPSIHERISTPDWDCLVMEFVEGDSLDEILRRGPMPEPEALRLGVQFAQGLAAIHQAEIVHRDLKPANLRITPGGHLKIMDFGLAQQPPSITETSFDVSVTGTIAGTAAYIAPEVWQGNPPTRSSDLYAAGVVLYEMATGLHPFREQLPGGAALATLQLNPPRPRERNAAISAEFEDVILRCMEKDPARRMSSAEDLVHALEGLLAQERSNGAAPPRRWRRIRLPVRGWVVLGGALLAAAGVYAIGWNQSWWIDRAAPIRSLAVLPFANLSGDPRQDYLADGMTDELIAILGEEESLRVIPRTSAMRYKGIPQALPAIARDLAVQGVVQGSVQSSGDKVRFSVQLIDARDDRQLWFEQYAGDREEVLAIQSRVARAIAREIGLRLRRGSRSSAERIDPVAHDLYLRGRFQWNRRDADGVNRAIQYFAAAIERDSLYAVAYCGSADAWTTAGHLGLFPPTEAYPRAKQAALRALSLDSTLSEAHASLANIRQNFDRDWDGAARDFRRAIDLNDNNPIAHHWYSNHLAFRGEFDRAMAEIRRAEELDPIYLPIHVGAAACTYFARQYDQALITCRRAVELDSTSGLPYRVMAANYYQLGRTAEAVEAFQRWLATQYPRQVSERASDGYQQGGIRGMARVLIRDLSGWKAAGRYVPASYLAELSILDRDRDGAIHWLQVAFDEHDTELNRLKVDPLFDPLRGDPRFEELQRKVGLGPPL